MDNTMGAKFVNELLKFILRFKIFLKIDPSSLLIFFHS